MESPGARGLESTGIGAILAGTMPAERAGMRVQAFLSLSSLVVLSSITAVGGIGCAPAAPEPDDLAEVETDGPEPEETVDQESDAVTGGTVAQAVANSCSTTSVKGLSQQIIAEGNCMNGNIQSRNSPGESHSSPSAWRKRSCWPTPLARSPMPPSARMDSPGTMRGMG